MTEEQMYYYGVSCPGITLRHYGIKGQKWGERRFQNEDGSYTAAGKARYSVGESAKKLGQVAKKYSAGTVKSAISGNNSSNSTSNFIRNNSHGAAVVGPNGESYRELESKLNNSNTSKEEKESLKEYLARINSTTEAVDKGRALNDIGLSSDDLQSMAVNSKKVTAAASIGAVVVGAVAAAVIATPVAAVAAGLVGVGAAVVSGILGKKLSSSFDKASKNAAAYEEYDYRTKTDSTHVNNNGGFITTGEDAGTAIRKMATGDSSIDRTTEYFSTLGGKASYTKFDSKEDYKKVKR